MNDFTTKKSEVLLEDVTVNGQDIYLNLSASNMMQTAGFANKVNMEDPEEMDKMAQMLFTPKSYELVSLLDLEDFITVLDLASKLLDTQEKAVTERFRRSE
jgi:hypothetical protein